MNEFEPLTPDELLYSLEKLVSEFGASNAQQTVLDHIAGFDRQELTARQRERLKAL